MGRNRKLYRKKYNALIAQLASERKSDIEIAQSLGIAKTTLKGWYAKYPQLAEAVEDARELRVRTQVEASMYKRAEGFKETERVIEVDPKDPSKVLSMKVRERYFPPNVAAGMILLTNKLPTEYKNRQSIEHSGKVGIKTYIGWSPAEWDDAPALEEGHPMRNVTGSVAQLEAGEKAGDA